MQIRDACFCLLKDFSIAPQFVQTDLIRFGSLGVGCEGEKRTGYYFLSLSNKKKFYSQCVQF